MSSYYVKGFIVVGEDVHSCYDFGCRRWSFDRTHICLIGVITEVPITKTKIGSLPFQASYVQIPNHSMERVLVSLYILYIFIQCFLRKTLKQNTIFLCGVIFFSFQRIYIFYLIRHSQILSLCLYQRNRKGLTSDY